MGHGPQTGVVSSGNNEVLRPRPLQWVPEHLSPFACWEWECGIWSSTPTVWQGRENASAMKRTKCLLGREDPGNRFVHFISLLKLLHDTHCLVHRRYLINLCGWAKQLISVEHYRSSWELGCGKVQELGIHDCCTDLKDCFAFPAQHQARTSDSFLLSVIEFCCNSWPGESSCSKWCATMGQANRLYGLFLKQLTAPGRAQAWLPRCEVASKVQLLKL